MRKDEALRLTWGDLDLEHGKVALDENNTDDPRAWALDPSVVVALKRWRELRKEPPRDTAKVFGGIVDHTHLPEDLRAHLQAAGVTRADLFKTTPTHRQINVHGLRDVRDDEPRERQDRDLGDGPHRPRVEPKGEQVPAAGPDVGRARPRAAHTA